MGDHVALAAWQHIWLNEGFATYSEWLWSEHKGRGTAQEIFDGFASMVGEEDFFRIVRRWIDRNAGGNVTTPQFIALAERISGEDVDDLFEEWLFTGAKPASLEPAASARALAAATAVERAVRPHAKR